MKKNTRRVLMALLAFMFVVSSGMTVRDLLRSKREKAANAALAEQVRELERDAEPSAPAIPRVDTSIPVPIVEPEPPSPYAESGLLRQYDPLYEQNQDMAGWLRIEGTAIDYPVMYTPDNIENYLRKAFDGAYALSGTLFLGAGWSEDANYAIIFGHHMEDGSMFGDLVQYASEDYGREHALIRFDTLTDVREYELVAALYSRIYTNQDHGVFRYYQYTDLSDEETFRDYVSRCKASALYDTGIEPVYGDRLLTLSTCNYHTQNGRFVVLARQRET